MWRCVKTNLFWVSYRFSDVAPVANSPTEVLSVLSGTHLSLTLFGEHSAPGQEFERSAELSGPRGSPTRSP